VMRQHATSAWVRRNSMKWWPIGGCRLPVGSTDERCGTSGLWIWPSTNFHVRFKGPLGMTDRPPMAFVRLRYVHEYVDRHGAVRRYFRRRGFPSVALPGLPGSREFREAYEAALEANPPPQTGKGGPGSLSDLVADFFRSPGFA